MNLLLGALFVLIGFWFLWRVEAVWSERARVLDRVHELATADIRNHQPWQWRYEDYETISFWRMMFSLRRVDEFYDEWGSPEP